MVWQRIKLILSASMCVFNGGFMRLGPDFSCFGHHLLRYLWSREKLNAVPIVFRQSLFFFLQHVSLTLFYLCPRRFWQSMLLLALFLGGTSKGSVFEKIYTLRPSWGGGGGGGGVTTDI